MKTLITLIAILLFSIIAYSKSPEEKDYNIKIEKVLNLANLPNNEVRRLYQDSDGFIWIATTGGLYKFDGYNITEYRSSIYNPQLLTSNNIICIFEDNDKKIYIGTNNGLNILNKKSGNIQIIDELLGYRIEDIIQYTEDNIWIATKKGIYSHDKNKKTYKKIFNKNIIDLYIDSKDNIWAGTWENGLFRYNKKEDEWIKYPKFNNRNSVHFIFEDSKNRIWLGSFGSGVTLLNNPYDLEKLSWTNFTAEDKENKISDDYIYAIAENKITGSLLFGTRKGISILPISDENKFRWNNIYPSIKNNSPLPFNEVDAIINDKQGNIWIGTLGGGVYCIKASNNGFHTNLLLEVQQKLHSNTVKSIYVDSKKQVWTGIGTNGYSIYKDEDTKTLSTTKYNNDSESFTRVNCITESPYNTMILLGAQDGLYYYNNPFDYNNQYPKKYNINDNKEYSISQIINSKNRGFWIAGINLVYHIDNKITKKKDLFNEKNEYNTIIQTSNNTIWTGTTSNGIIKIQFDEKTFKVKNSKKYNTENRKSPVHNILHLFQDKEKRIWAGTDGGGLCVYNEQKDIFESINTMTDFPTDVVNSITEDSEGTLWLGSNIGLIRFYPATDLSKSTFRLYNKSNGLPDNHFLPRAVSQSENGEIYFGTHHGYIHFYPEEINTVDVENNVFITDFKINSHSIKPSVIPGYAKTIDIPGNYSNFTIEFSPMLYSAPEKVRYAYQLEGYDKEWLFTGADKRFAHYANLSPGKYEFKLKCTNEYGIWNSITRKVEIRINPPFYMTWWAYIVYTIIITIIIVYIYSSVRQRIRLRTAIQIQRIDKEKSDELNQAKLRFFTNITHELFTPITIISAAIEDSKRSIPEKEYNIISSNTNRLVRLIQQVLEFRKAETGNLKLQVARQNLSQFTEKNIESFIPLMRQKNISIDFKCNNNEIYAYFDSDKIDKILYNLLSNGLKYNTEGAHIDVTLHTENEGKKAILEVRDNGNGLSEKTMKNLFKRFYDGDFRKFNTIGTGIGLSLVKDLVTLHKGEIYVDNHPGKGVGFIITIPIDAETYTQEECSDNKVQSELLSVSHNNEDNTTEEHSNISILIVEDNPDLILLLRNILSRKYNVFTAENGKEAIGIMKEQDIQLVISDVMMPEMDGYELCKVIKESIEFSHIPIILLTAKTAEEDVVSAYQSGADGYLKKPFSVSVLNARIENLLQAREKRISEFKAQQVFNPQGLNYTTPDEEFIKQVMDCIYDNYTDPDFDQNRLAEVIGLSKSTIYRKLKSLIGMTTSNLIKDVRLKMARELLNKKGGARISEIAYMVGFNDPKYFSMCFKKEYGILPSELEE